MQHLITPTVRVMRTCVLQSTLQDSIGQSQALLHTMQVLQAELQSSEIVDVFADPNGLPIALRSSPQWRWWPACVDLLQALALIQPNGWADVAWVQAGWQVSREWRNRLQQALWSDSAIAAVGALSLNDAWRSPLPDRQVSRLTGSDLPGGLFEGLSSWLAAHASAEPVELACWPHEAGVLRGSAAARISHALIKGDPLQRSKHDGFQLLASGAGIIAFNRQVLTYNSASKGSESCERAGGLAAERQLWRHSHPLSAVRSALAEYWPQLMRDVASGPQAPTTALEYKAGTFSARTPEPARSVRLHVAHSWGGGLSKWVGDFIRADQDTGTGTGLVLRSVGVFGAFGQRLCLYAGDEEVVPLRYWELGVPIHATATGHLQVRKILREIIDDFGVDQVVVSSLIGHSIDVLRTGLPTVVIAHDHYPFCVTLYAHFEGECRSCTPERLEQCLSRNPAHRFFRGAGVDEWMSLREAFMQVVVTDRIPIVAPASSVAARWRAMMPALDASQFRVIEHGLNLPAAPTFTPATEGRLRILVLGRLTPEKGVGLLLEMLDQLLEFADLLLVGCGERIDPAFSRQGVTCIAHFDNRELPATLAAMAPNIGLLMSTVPETFSYTLSELQHIGIPVVATDSGALADRVVDGVTGYLVEARADALLRRLQQLNGDRPALQRMRAHLLTLPARGIQDMLRDYLALMPSPARKGAGAHRKPPELAMMEGDPAPGIGTGAGRSSNGLHKALLVNPQATWLQAARAFWQFTYQKAVSSPRLPAPVKRLLGRWAGS